MPDCNHDCDSCSLECDERPEGEPTPLKSNDLSNIKKVIAVVSGKGGVGKSLVTSILAVNAKRKGKAVAIIDADVTGPSIPTIFGLSEKATSDGTSIFPVKTKTGIEAMTRPIKSSSHLPRIRLFPSWKTTKGFSKTFPTKTTLWRLENSISSLPPLIPR